ncbi:MAG: RNA polymerase sigma factor [Pseudomonadota bacterium]
MKPSFEQILESNRARLVRVARQYAGPNDWQDLLQDMTLKIWQGLDSFDGRADLGTWIFRVALNTALAFARKRKIQTTPVTDSDLGSKHGGDPLHVLEAFLQSLDPMNRAMLLMELEGLSREEIADVLGVSSGAINVRMTRLKARFTEQFVETAQ